jgi:hypothetical protein
MAATATGACWCGCDGLTEAILPEAEIAATRRLDWRMALENMVVVLKRLCGWLCNQLRLMQTRKRGDGDGVEDGELCWSKRLAVAREESALPSKPNPNCRDNTD